MIKKNLWKIIITSLLTLLPIAVGLILWDKLPDEIPTHFNMAGEADGYSSKAFAVFGLPGFMFAVHLICTFATSIDPRHKNIEGKPFGLVLWITPALSLLVGAIIYLTVLGININVSVIMMIFMGLLFIVIGNYLPKCRQNYTIGIKVPWTLNDEENWNKTHRFAGKLWVICGVVNILLSFTGMFYLFFLVVIIATIAPIVYSYKLYKNKEN